MRWFQNPVFTGPRGFLGPGSPLKPVVFGPVKLLFLGA
jgi:hypothetical protein